IDLGTTGSLFQTDVTLSPRKVLFGASTVRFDAVLGLYDGSRGGAPQALGELALDPAFGGDTTGVAADDRFLYVTGTRGAATLGKPGYLGQTRMFIARYADFTDGAGIAPRCRSNLRPTAAARRPVGRSRWSSARSTTSGSPKCACCAPATRPRSIRSRPTPSRSPR